MPTFELERNGRKYHVTADSVDQALAALNDVSQNIPMYDQIGAPARVRMRVGAAKTPEDKLGTLRAMYPDAKPISNGNNYVYTDEEGRTVKYNDDRWTASPKALFGDLMENARMFAEMGGAGLGGMAGALGGLPGVMTGAGAGGAAAGAIYDKLSGAQDTRSATDILKQTAGDFALNALTGPLPAKQPVPPKNALIAAAEQIGAPLSVAQRTGSPLANSIEAALEGTVGGSGPIHRQRQAVSDAVQNASDIVTANKFASPHGAGSAITDAVTKFKKRTSDVSSKLYEKISDTFVRRGNNALSPIDIPHLKYLANQRAATKAAAGPFADLMADTELDNLNKVIQNLPHTGMSPPYQAIKEYRTSLFEKGQSPLLTTNTTQGALKRLTKAASADLDKAAEALGGPAGKRARDKANKFHALLKERMALLNPLVDTDPENAFKKIESSFYQSPTQFHGIMKSVDPANKDALLSTLMHRMGMATPGTQSAAGDAFSLARFKTNWNKMLKDAPENMNYFSDDQKRAIKNILIFAEDAQEFGRGVNYSRTGRVTDLQGVLREVAGVGGAGTKGGVTGAILGSLGGADPIITGALGAAASLGIPNLLARIMTNPTSAKMISEVPAHEAANLIARMIAAEANNP